MTKEEALSLEKIITKIDKADETNCKKEEEYNSFCTNTREDWDEEKYQKLKREKALTEAAYFAMRLKESENKHIIRITQNGREIIKVTEESREQAFNVATKELVRRFPIKRR